MADTQTSYDSVATSYADQVRNLLDETPYERAALALFADLVHATGGGRVADVGCGPGRITAYLRELGVDTFGIDLSPAMIEVARRDHPGLRFEVGSMTDLDLADASMAGLVAWYSTSPTTRSARSSRTSGECCGPVARCYSASTSVMSRG